VEGVTAIPAYAQSADISVVRTTVCEIATPISVHWQNRRVMGANLDRLQIP
jgi:hypothetical protein